MAYTVLARRYRPERFEDLIGQGNVAETLKNAIGMERIGHAYLFAGPRGVGKTSAARIFAKALNCDKGVSATPCLECETCLAISKGMAGDVYEIDGASNNSVDDVRDIRENAVYSPLKSPYKIYIIDEVHMVTRAGFNALLKILEEPPEHVVFVFATTEAHKIPETILSRCQRFDFRAMSESDIRERLQFIADEEKVKVSKEALYALARYSDGGMRNAQSCLDQLITYTRGEGIGAEHVSELLGLLQDGEIFGLLKDAAEQNFTSIISFCESLKTRNIQCAHVFDQLHQCVRDLLMLKNLGAEKGRGNIPDDRMDEAMKYAGDQSDQGFLAAIDLIQQGKTQMNRGLDPYLAFEMTLLNLGHLGQLPTLSELMGMMVASKKKTSASS